MIDVCIPINVELGILLDIAMHTRHWTDAHTRLIQESIHGAAITEGILLLSSFEFKTAHA